MKKRFAAAGIIAALAVVLFICSRHISGFGEKFTEIANPVFVNTFGRVFGLLPFSVAEMLLYAAVILVIFLIVSFVRKLYLVKAGRLPKGTAKRYGLSGLATLLLIGAICGFMVEAAQDVPFRREDFSERYGYGSGAYTTDDLASAAEYIAAKVNAYAGLVERNSSGIMQVSGGTSAAKNGSSSAVQSADGGSASDARSGSADGGSTGSQGAAIAPITQRVRTAMATAAEKYPVLQGYYPQPKKVLNSWILSWCGITGVYSSVTIEANVNREMTPYNIPFTMCHELAHLKGNMPEDECNFIACIACAGSEDADILYSGALSAWIYVSNELHTRDEALWQSVAETLDASADADLEANTAFWNARKGTVRQTAESLNDSYLKAHGEEEGIASYDRVVDLIVSKISRDGEM